MNPVAYRLKPKEPIPFLLIGEMVYYRGARYSERIWHLNVYSSAKTRRTAAKKLKRGKSDIIFVEWDITMEEIIQGGKMIFPVASEKVSLYTKLDILKQLNQL